MTVSSKFNIVLFLYSLLTFPSLSAPSHPSHIPHSYYRFDLTVEEAIELGKRAIVHATHRDAYSGGINNGTYSAVAVV
jgi:hypothetical protein